MNSLARIGKLPLLIKELTEQAGRRRTYLIRLGYALILFVATCVMFYGNLSTGQTTSVLGRGRPMFNQLVGIQFWGIYLLLPATVCGVISSEKEKESLSLLMLTTLTPWQIVIQKLLGRLIPMFSFLFISFPLMAVAFNNGGVTAGHLWYAIFLLTLTCLQVGAFALACSAFFRTTYESFTASYLGLLVLYWMMPPLFGLAVFESVQLQTMSEVVFIMMLMSCAAFLGLAWVFLEARAFVPARNYLLEFFRFLDSVFNDLNHVTGGVVLAKDNNLLPRKEPVAWRETSKKSLGTSRYLFRVLVVLQVPLILAFQSIGGTFGGGSIQTVTVLLYTLWGVSVALIAVHAAGLMSSERSRQTLNVLLTTPISARNLILQKFRGVRRLICVLCVPFLSIFLFEQWFKNLSLWYVLRSSLLVAIYLPLVAWFSMWIGLKIRSQVRATLVSMCAVAAWIVLPEAIRVLLLEGLSIDVSRYSQFLLILSPSVAIRAVETGAADSLGVNQPFWTFFLANVLAYGALLWLVRFLSLSNADRQLGRVKGKVS